MRERPRLLRLAPRIAAVVALLPLGCKDAQAPAPPVVSERRIAPATANPDITRWTADHLVWVADTGASDRIMLLLPGTGGTPQGARLIGSVAASLGYRGIGLMYANDIAVMQVCGTDPDVGCMARMRAEIVEGGDQSPHVEVDAANSIDGRLADLLRYLAAQHPDEAWESFLAADGSPRWDRIAVAGLSQGGGHAAYIAKLRAVPRLIMFGAPADGIGGAQAPWMQIGATPADRYYGFRHERDPFQSVSANWQALGLEAFGAPQTVDETTTAFGNTHLFITDLLPATGTYNHAHPSVYIDVVTPKRADGQPAFDALWRHLLGRR